MDNFRIISVSHVKGKLWNVVYQIENKNDFETVEALDSEEAYRLALKIISNELNK